MLSITIRDKATADEQGSPYVVLVTADATAYSAYATIEEFMQEWHDTLDVADLNSRSFTGSKSINLMADYNVHTVYEYSDGLQACINNGARPCKLLSNGEKRRGAILVDAVNKQTTFFQT